MLLLSLNEAFDRGSLDLLLALEKVKDGLFVSGDGVLTCASLVATDMVSVEPIYQQGVVELDVVYHIQLTAKGQSFLSSWKKGDQQAAVGGDT
jgi:hypothetical protein